MKTETLAAATCYHCGSKTTAHTYEFNNRHFCCIGCQSVYQVLSSSDMCSYYAYNDNPGKVQDQSVKHLEYLDEPSIAGRLLDYSDDKISSITLYVPSIHCSSCIWLLEHLYKFNPAIVHSRIDFLKKQVAVTFKHNEVSLRQIVELMLSVGYEPLISLQDVVKEKKQSVNRDLITKIAVAGFCMGNVMLLSFPEYFGLSALEQQFRSLFGWLNLAFTIPVFFYCSRDFFVSAWAGLKHRMINLDAPLALIILILFLRSAFEITTQTGPGFSDTLTGLVFLLLSGRWVKQRSYNHVSFDRDFRSYFPVAVTLLRDGKEQPIPIEEISIGDRILIRNNEIVPADSILMKGEGFVDFSFVTGESAPDRKVMGEIIYAGGRQDGEAIELEVIKPVSKSYLTSLWNNDTFTKPGEDGFRSFNDSIAKYFSIITFIIAFSSAAYWLTSADQERAWNAFTAVLIVACPCVLALSSPFTLTAVLNIFDKKRFYLKSTDVVEKLARIDTIVFDKTGTLTSSEKSQITFTGTLTHSEKALIASLARNSTHPLSREITAWGGNKSPLPVTSFVEIAGKGISGVVDSTSIRIGSLSFIKPEVSTGGSAHVEIAGRYKGYFTVKQGWRQELHLLFNKLKWKFDMYILSGDNESDKQVLLGFFPFPHHLFFKQSPHEKLAQVRSLQLNKNVMMLGDGLNDAGALKQSNVGIAVTDDINTFNPACDAILDGKSLGYLPSFIRQAKDAVLTIKMSFVISASYNVIGIYYAVQGLLSPLIAAVLMPLSTITIIAFTSAFTKYFSLKNKLS